LSVVFEMVRMTNALLEENKTTAETFAAVDDLFRELGGDVLGIVKERYPQSDTSDEQLMDGVINILIEQRNNARNNKDFAAADAIRDKLSELGITLEDKPGETIWRTK